MAAPPAPAAFDAAALRFVAVARVARLATAGQDGAPAVVPICFALDEAAGTPLLYTPIDAKPKRTDWRRLQRVRNLLANPAVAVVVDRWDEDWTRLAWVHLRGRAELVEPAAGDPRHPHGIALLRAKYEQYRAMPLEDLPLIAIAPTSLRHWGDLAS